jgi:hypothetical protein
LANLPGADFSEAQLQGASFRYAQIQGADFSEAQLQGVSFRYARIQGASFRYAHVQGANLGYAQLQGADLGEAQLQGADLRGVQFQGADLHKAALWRSRIRGARWNFADLRATVVEPMAKADIDALIDEATTSIPDEERQKAVAERLTEALRTSRRSARPDFPEEWRSDPDVMFQPGAPKPEPFDWGPRKWITEHAYDEDLAKFLGDLACGRNAPEAQTRGLARQALWQPDRLFAQRLAVRLAGPDCPPAKGCGRTCESSSSNSRPRLVRSRRSSG